MGKKEVVWCPRNWFPVRVCFCPGHKAWARLMQELELDEPFPENGAARITTITRQDQEAICILSFAPGWRAHDCAAIAGTVAHEAVHVWQTIRDMIGEDKPSSEFEAYSVQAIFLELLNAMEEATGWKL